MFCPRCGRESSETQRFCTTCGTNLLTVSQALGAPAISPAEQAARDGRLREFNKGMKTLFTGIGLAVFFMFVTHSWAPVGIGLMIFIFGVGQMIRSMVAARPRLDIHFDTPGSLPWARSAKTPAMTPPTSPPPVAPAPGLGSVTEDATMRLGSSDSFSRPGGK